MTPTEGPQPECRWAPVCGTAYIFGIGGNLEGAFSANWSNGAIKWVEDCHGDTYGSFPKGDVIYVASHSHYCGNLPDGFPQTDPWTQHYGTAYTKATLGTLATPRTGCAASTPARRP